MNSFIELTAYFFHAIIQSVLLWAPIVNPLQESYVPPIWWYRCHTWADWIGNLDSDRRPTAALMDLYWSCLWVHVGDLVDAAADRISGLKDAAIRALLGVLPWLYDSFSRWLQVIDERLGLFLPSWAQSVIDGLVRLWNWLPSGIRHGWRTWQNIWDGIFERARDWVVGWLDEARRYAYTLWEWLTETGRHIASWWRDFGFWLAVFAQNPLGVITALLGAAWTFLVGFFTTPIEWVKNWLDPYWTPLETFARDCLTFWYNIWGSYSSLLADFLADPMGFIGDRLEQILVDRW